MRWNLSSARRAANDADVFFISFPKSGRTWYRMFWSAYWCHRAGRAFELDPRNIEGMPKVLFTHDRWDHETEINTKKRWLGHYLIPAAAAESKRKFVLARDPRDVIVSLFFHLTKRSRERRVQPETMKQLVRDPQFGIAHIVRLLNEWNAEWKGTPTYRFARYEDARAAAAPAMREWMAFAGVAEPDPASFQHALEFTDFETVRKREKEGSFGNKLLDARDPSDPESFKARRGKVGGYTDYLDRDDLAVCSAEIAKLDPVFGYTP
ncbi:MAG: hypothetical protein K0Q76_576 [Panacagrimonas sp.]|jgi:hypothetical protein|nr:sulfotransferase domain-containing protein [Panacagrimonas sp.]MCC2655468.1 hypothetical protein [Panacagrimonas sp.]